MEFRWSSEFSKRRSTGIQKISEFSFFVYFSFGKLQKQTLIFKLALKGWKQWKCQRLLVGIYQAACIALFAVLRRNHITSLSDLSAGSCDLSAVRFSKFFTWILITKKNQYFMKLSNLALSFCVWLWRYYEKKDSFHTLDARKHSMIHYYLFTSFFVSFPIYHDAYRRKTTIGIGRISRIFECKQPLDIIAESYFSPRFTSWK